MKMMANTNADKSHLDSDMTKYNGTAGAVNGVNNNNNNNNINNNSSNHNGGMVVNVDKNSNQPFSQTLQGYSDNFKENHSEISC